MTQEGKEMLRSCGVPRTVHDVYATVLLNPTTNIQEKSHPYFTGKSTRAQRVDVTCPRSYS